MEEKVSERSIKPVICSIVLPKEILDYVDRQVQEQLVPREGIIMRLLDKGLVEERRERFNF